MPHHYLSAGTLLSACRRSIHKPLVLLEHEPLVHASIKGNGDLLMQA